MCVHLHIFWLFKEINHCVASLYDITRWKLENGSYRCKGSYDITPVWTQAASIHLQPLVRYESACVLLFVPSDTKKESLCGEIQHLGSFVFQGSHRLQVRVLYLSAHNRNVQFPSLTSGRQLLLHVQPPLPLRPPSNAFASHQSVSFSKHVGAWVLVSVHSPRLPAPHLQGPERDHSQTAPWKSIFEFGSPLQSFQFVWRNC